MCHNWNGWMCPKTGQSGSFYTAPNTAPNTIPFCFQLLSLICILKAYPVFSCTIYFIELQAIWRFVRIIWGLYYFLCEYGAILLCLHKVPLWENQKAKGIDSLKALERSLLLWNSCIYVFTFKTSGPEGNTGHARKIYIESIKLGISYFVTVNPHQC